MMRGEKIYFLLIDRFHDGLSRNSISSRIRKTGYGNTTNLSTHYGGNLKGITQKLDYIKTLGFTAIWLSPFFHNQTNAYHGYAIKDFTNVDPNFGNKDDLLALTQKAHQIGLKVYMDAIINHSGNTWSYLQGKEYIYNQGIIFPFGNWTENEYPKPESLKNIEYYERKGRISNWERHDELMLGDFYELKKFKLDESDTSIELQDLLIEIYSYWINEFGFDGLRIDTARHLTPLVLNRFCHKIKQSAKEYNGKDLFIFIEAPFLNDEELLPYFTLQRDKSQNVYTPPDGFLDFQSHFILPTIIKRPNAIDILTNRFKNLANIQKRADSPMTPISFLDNHDQVGESTKSRISHKLPNLYILKSYELLLRLKTIPCLYYGTEQGLDGIGNHDKYLRYSMFDKYTKDDLFDSNYHLYRQLKTINRKY